MKKDMKTSCCKSGTFSQLNGTPVCLNERCINYLSGTSLNHCGFRGKWVAAFVLFSFYVLFSFENFSMKPNHSTLTEYVKPEPPPAAFSATALQAELDKQGVLCAEAVYGQMRLESGHFKSFLFIHANNLMGMRYPFSRPTRAAGLYLPARDTVIRGTQASLKPYRKVANTYAVYDTWQDAVADYKLWQDHCFNLNERYLEFLGRVYAQDAQYVDKLKMMASMK